MRRKILFSLFIILNSMAQEKNSSVHKYLEDLTHHNQFNGIVLIAHNSEIVFHQAYGLANHELNVKNHEHTKFRIASITKQFTAALILRLQELSLLKIADTVDQYIPDYPNGNAITLHHLLSHTSGLARIQEIPDISNILRIPHTKWQMVTLFKDRHVKFNPSNFYDYSNASYLLLTYIIELVTKKSFGQALQELILTPAGMHESGSDNNSLILKDRASGYCLAEDQLQNAPYIDMALCGGSGGMYATAHDLYLWNQALYSGKIINQNSLSQMLSPHTQSLAAFEGCIGWDLSYAQYGYGMRVGTLANGNHFSSHEGIFNGFYSNLLHIFESNTDIIILSNFQHAPIKDITDRLLITLTHLKSADLSILDNQSATIRI